MKQSLTCLYPISARPLTSLVRCILVRLTARLPHPLSIPRRQTILAVRPSPIYRKNSRSVCLSVCPSPPKKVQQNAQKPVSRFIRWQRLWKSMSPLHGVPEDLKPEPQTAAVCSFSHETQDTFYVLSNHSRTTYVARNSIRRRFVEPQKALPFETNAP